uniref:Cytochrome P450 n=1 Tax=Phlebotomus papatasi TaxID=29031 RepID=A0A1B0EZR3_PHLPP
MLRSNHSAPKANFQSFTCVLFSTAADVTLNGYVIPAGAHVVPLINSVHMDPTLWDNPEEFNPNRFINAEGKVQKPEYFMPFGVGRRIRSNGKPAHRTITASGSIVRLVALRARPSKNCVKKADLTVTKRLYVVEKKAHAFSSVG